jgi:hypothetical protein
MFSAVMDQVERNLEAVADSEKLENFREARRKDYSIFVVQESLIGDQVSPELLDFVTKREMAAGRMRPDHPLRQAAEQGLAEPHLSPAEMLAQHDAKVAVAAAPQPASATPMRFNPSQGLMRIAAVIRWLGYGVAGLLVAAGMGGLLFGGREGPSMLLAGSVAGAIVAGTGWAAAWIIEGFAGARG